MRCRNPIDFRLHSSGPFSVDPLERVFVYCARRGDGRAERRPVVAAARVLTIYSRACFGVPQRMHKSKGAGMLLIGVGTHLAAMVIAGFLLGYGVDAWLDTRPVFMLLLGGLGFVGGILKAHKLLGSGLG